MARRKQVEKNANVGDPSLFMHSLKFYAAVVLNFNFNIYLDTINKGKEFAHRFQFFKIIFVYKERGTLPGYEQRDTI